MPPSTLETSSAARVALERACEHLLSLQDEAGWWKGELQTNVTMDAEDMLLREFLGIRTAAQTERSAVWIRSQQRVDGTWTNFHGGEGELSTTIEAYWALKLAGDDPAEAHMQAAAQFIRAQGGIERSRVFTHVWLALFGLWSWERVPALPPEIVLLPSWVPLNIYDFACWARQTIVALTIVIANRPCRQLAIDLDELHGPPYERPLPRGLSAGAWLVRLDRVLRAYERHPLRPLRALALARAERWIVRRQEADGSWGGIQPPWVYSLMALRLAGYPLEHPLMRRGLEGLDRFMIEDPGAIGGPRPSEGPVGLPARSVERPAPSRPPTAPPGPSRRLEACQSPVWDTALALIALADAGLAPEHPAMHAGARWLLAEEVGVRGDWAVARPELPAGGWAFEFANDNYPDTDDTAEVVLALLRALPQGGPYERDAAGARQRSGGARVAGAGGSAEGSAGGSAGGPGANGAAAADGRSPGGREHKGFLNGGGVDVAPNAAIRGGARARARNARANGVRWLEGMQSAGGGWGAFDADNTRALVRELPFLDFGEVIDEPSADVTAHVLELLAAVGRAGTPIAQTGLRWLLDQQEPDGSWFGRWGVNYLYGTGAALPALAAMGLPASDPAVRRAVGWLHEHQNADGGWGEDPRSYDDPASWSGRGESTASQTAWALLALHAAGETGAEAAARGIAWLVQTQREDGTWDEPQYTGTGFPCDYYINYHLYRLTFPVMALGRCLRDAMPGPLGRAVDLATAAGGAEGAAAAATGAATNGASPNGTAPDGASTRER
jgi:squalene-hopene/tetraprenyl-beta-curcumene cyclase